MIGRWMIYVVVCLASTAIAPRAARAQDDDFERAPIHYSTATPNDPVAQLVRRIDRGEASLEFTPGLGYLPALLRELDIPASSQGFVFSRTSLQRQKISASKPRAIYFNDETYVGFVQDGMIELAAADPTLGAVFYTIDNDLPDAQLRDRVSDPVGPARQPPSLPRPARTRPSSARSTTA